MIAPLPDEAAVQPGEALCQLVVDVHAAWAIAHRMGVLAHQEGFAADSRSLVWAAEVEDVTALRADRLGLEVVGVHAGIEVGVRAGVITLIVDWPPWVAASHPLRHPHEVTTGSRFVAEGPDDHRWVILVPLDGAFHPVQAGFRPAGIIARVSLPAKELEPVRFIVTFLDHPEAQLVGKIKYSRMGRIVAGTDRVDTGPLHHDQVGPRIILVEHATADRVDLVPIHPAEDHLPSVDTEEVTGYLNSPETQPQAQRFRCGADAGLVEPRHLSTPRLDLSDRERRNFAGQYEPLLDAELGNLNLDRKSMLFTVDLGIDRSSPVGRIVGAQPEIIYRPVRTAQHRDVAKDTR